MEGIMRKALVSVIIAGVFALTAPAALSATVKLAGTHTIGQILQACILSEGGHAQQTAGTGPGGYGCRTDKGEVSCDRDGHCTGTCDNCGNASAPGTGGIRAILSASTKAHAPMHEMTPQ
jgi:hypothetical protein